MIEYSSKGEAQKAAEEEEDIYCREHYCPLLKSPCRSDCVAFHHMKVRKNRSGSFSLNSVVGCTAPYLIDDSF